MKKTKILSLLGLMPLLTWAIPTIASCNKNSPTQQCLITFVVTGGGTLSSTKSITVEKGTKWGKINNKPAPVPNNNCEFDNWYNGTAKVTNETPINSNITITAKFNEITLSKTVDTVLYCVNYAGTDYEEAGDISSTYGNLYKIRHFDNSSCGYISIDQYLGDWWSYYFDVTTADSKTTITNKTHATRSGVANTCIVDHVNQTITFEDYEEFIDRSSNTYGPMTYGCNGGHNYFNSVTINEYVKNSSLVIDLSKYNMKTYCYTIDGTTNGYMPYEFISSVFGLYLASNIGYDWDYNGAGLFEIVEGRDSATANLKVAAKNKAASGFYNADYMEYSYNLLALTLDLRFGLIERKSRANPGETIKYLENGAYAMLKPYHDQLVSLEDDVSNDALRAVFKEKLDDGGHALYWNLNALSTQEVPSTYAALAGKEYEHTGRTMSAMKTARKDAGIGTASKTVTTDAYKVYEPTDASKGKIAYITFDSFTAQSGLVTGETKRELPAYTDDTNFYNDTLRLTMYANKKIKADSTIKNVVVDLSCNGGGTVYTEFFIASWLCGGVNEKIYNPKTGSYCDFTVKADIDGDGDFDQDDYLDPNIQLFIITSSCSFSCGNMLPVNVQDNRPSSIFIGTPSGGGACYVDDGIYGGLGSMLRLSSDSHMIRKASTSTNFITVDDGCSITSGWAIPDSTTATACADFFDRDTINNQIWEI